MIFIIMIMIRNLHKIGYLIFQITTAGSVLIFTGGYLYYYHDLVYN